ncbi:hypothetical protein METBIDRAFT_11857 [Metschnikowia bicuspidata var. bicuspidata NRRL YB-4993]|uniref:Cyclin-domain-containing protein n=1 Tax=Metschnikowia bicuspidata var. bicuspidata NRRL YB-4993 TaxID=869754 RepID=A0A1A0HBQ8_9ASCO|nr:hypothetical protein METBIDRAFT_11857 [Metschnikowia bicuspidata var. bicuspidata NRRL YB-4993]OBA21323.1 hypothetical protein METBIDRAFT_11857 [Metschnikowia bicuspidata var. bicuspidata NRRL YB-4993]
MSLELKKSQTTRIINHQITTTRIINHQITTTRIINHQNHKPPESPEPPPADSRLSPPSRPVANRASIPAPFFAPRPKSHQTLHQTPPSNPTIRASFFAPICPNFFAPICAILQHSPTLFLPVPMTSTYTSKDVADIPLKRPQETFVDDPGSLDEVNIDDLVFRLAHDIKGINSLHSFHAVAVLKAVLEDLILLGAHRDARREFRRSQLQQYSLDLQELQEPPGAGPQDCGSFPDGAPGHSLPGPGRPGFSAVDLSLAGEPVISESTRPMSQEDASVQSLVAADAGNDDTGGSGTALFESAGSDSALLENAGSDSALLESAGTGTAGTETALAETALAETAGAEAQAGFISTESLVQTTSLDRVQDPITCHSIQRLRDEVLFHLAPKIRQQALHLLRCFELARPPPISLGQFLGRIQTYLPSISVSVYIHSAYMLYKLCVLLDVVELTQLNAYRLVLGLLRCLTKKLEDVYQKQKSFATVGGVALDELSKIEVSFLYLSNFKIIVSEHMLNQFLTVEFPALREYSRDRVALLVRSQNPSSASAGKAARCFCTIHETRDQAELKSPRPAAGVHGQGPLCSVSAPGKQAWVLPTALLAAWVSALQSLHPKEPPTDSNLSVEGAAQGKNHSWGGCENRRRDVSVRHASFSGKHIQAGYGNTQKQATLIVNIQNPGLETGQSIREIFMLAGEKGSWKKAMKA